MILEDDGFTVDEYTDTLLAFSDFRPNKYDLLNLDIMMPSMDGFELHREVKELDNTVKACLLTASEKYYETFREKEYSSLGKDLFLYKPIENKEWVKKINKIPNAN